MYIEKIETETILRSEQGFDMVDKKEWNSFVPTEEKPFNDTYRFNVAYLPSDMTLEECQELYMEIDSLTPTK